jgi:septum formation protein
MNLILASASPRRKELLSGMGLTFEVLVSDVDEDFSENLTAVHIPEMLAIRKAEAVRKIRQEAFVIAADTIVECNGKILNKPDGPEQALKMLEEISGRIHFVHTGFCIAGPQGSYSGCDTTLVKFLELSRPDMDQYIQSGRPFDKAGGYGIQEWIGLIGVERIEGSYFTVMGLPTHRIWQGLKELHFQP